MNTTTQSPLIVLFRRFSNAHFTSCADEHREGASDASVNRHYEASELAERNFLAALRAQEDALKACIAALATCYDVVEYPANGKTPQDEAGRLALAALAATPPASPDFGPNAPLNSVDCRP